MKNHLPLRFVPLLLLLLCGCNRTPPAPIGPLFDVPSLLGKSMKDVEKRLGAPSQASEGRKIWQKDGAALTVKFSPTSDIVTGFSLDAQGEPRKDEEREDFLKIGSLKAAGDARYHVAFIEAPDKVFHFSGVRVDLPQTHKVELRVDGPQVLVSITYALMSEGSGGSGDNFLNLPPWNVETNATIGQKIVLAVAVMSKPGQSPPAEKLRLQIVIDDRVLKETSAVGSAKCEAQL